MATLETQKLDDIISSRRAMMLGGAALAGLALTGTAEAQAAVTDNDVLNFALNLEFLEGEFYTLATTGKTLQQTSGVNTGAGGTAIASGATGATITVKANPKIAFTLPAVQGYALELALEEQRHIAFLQRALGTAAIAEPNIDLQNSFVALGALIGVPNFDPFANDYAFLIGNYIFPDVGTSAYHGGALLLTDKNILDSAAKIHAIEAYHAGTTRTLIYSLDQVATPLGPAGSMKTLTQLISRQRTVFDGTISSTPDDVGVSATATVSLNGTNYTASTVVNADSNAIGWARNTTEVLGIAYAGGAPGTGGGFFPNGFNGTIK